MFTRNAVGFCPVCRRALEQVIDHVTPDEPGAPRDDGDGLRHAASSCFIVRTLK
jgi:hypothetical protein